MFSDIVELREFYQSPLGRTARRLLRARVAELWPSVAGETVAAIGYGAPLLRPWLGEARALYALMPARQGVTFWPREGPNLSCLVEEDRLPLPDSSVDRVVILHALEALADPAALLREAWRVLKGGGRLLILVPNRHGLWAHSDRTPFGCGQPFSPTQLRGVLHRHGFLIERTRAALYALPSGSRLALSLADRIEKTAGFLFPGFGGVLIVEAGKQLYAPRGEKSPLRHRLLLPLPLPGTRPLPTGRIA